MTILSLDIADASSIKRAVEIVRDATTGTLDILVNNAGIGGIPQSAVKPIQCC